jgi:hypothetical protein
MVKMVVLAVVAQKYRQAEQEYQVKVLLAVAVERGRHRVVAAAQVLLAQMEHQAHLALAVLAQHHLFLAHLSPMLVEVVEVRQATKHEE